MQVVLLERIEKLGQMGDVVTVKDGFARNYLLPRKKALRATKTNLAYFEQQRAQLEAANLKRRQEAEAVAKKMEGIMVNLVRQASETGHLYGSVRPQDITESLKAEGYLLERSQIDLSVPIKELGIHAVRVRLHPEVIISINVNIAMSEEEAEVQAKKQQIESEKAETLEASTGSAKGKKKTEAAVEAASEVEENA